VGSPALLDSASDPARIDSAHVLLEEAEQLGRTAIVVLVDNVPAAVLGVADRLRPTARDTVAALRSLTGQSPILLTGDNPRAAAQLAAEVGITDVRAGLLPEDKLDVVTALQADLHLVLLVGDGVNDAPALAAADVGVAMGRQGSDLALESADAVIVRDELSTLPAMIELSRRAHRVVRANLAFAATVIIVLVAWDIAGTLPLPLGVAGHEGSTVVVGLNGLRLLRKAVWPGLHGSVRAAL
jgi:P-type E1-E2 ATPase